MFKDRGIMVAAVILALGAGGGYTISQYIESQEPRGIGTGPSDSADQFTGPYTELREHSVMAASACPVTVDRCHSTYPCKWYWVQGVKKCKFKCNHTHKNAGDPC